MRRRHSRGALVGRIALAALVLAGVAACGGSARPSTGQPSKSVPSGFELNLVPASEKPPYPTARALADKIQCAGFRDLPGVPQAADSGTCTYDGHTLTVIVFTSKAQQDAYSQSVLGHYKDAVVGDRLWEIVGAKDIDIVRRLVALTGGGLLVNLSGPVFTSTAP